MNLLLVDIRLLFKQIIAFVVVAAFFSNSLLAAAPRARPIKTTRQIIVKRAKYINKKSVPLATALSLIPGAGHLYLNDPLTASGLVGTMALSGFSYLYGKKNDRPLLKDIGGIYLQNTYFYGVYAAYRDARKINKNRGYRYRMPKDSLAQLAYAPFEWKVISKPRVYLGLLGGLAGAILVGLASKVAGSSMTGAIRAPGGSIKSLLLREAYLGAFTMPVGIGEEALFRGVLQPALSEPFGKWGGLAAASTLFGAAHIPNGFAMPEGKARNNYFIFSVPFIAAAGGYMGYMSNETKSLKSSVALHFWYDLVVFSLSALGAAIKGNNQASFSFTIPL